MKLLLAVSLAVLTVTLAVDPNQNTDAGKQESKGTKTGDKAEIVASQKGGKSGSGDFTGTADGSTKTATSNKGHKAVVLGENNVKASGSDGDNTAKKDGDSFVANAAKGGEAKVAGFAKDGDTYKPTLTGGGKELKTVLDVTNADKFTGTASAGSDKWQVELPGGKKATGATVSDNGKNVAVVSNLQNQEEIKIDQKTGKGNPTLFTGTRLTNGVRETYFKESWAKVHKANVKEDASHTEIQSGLAKTSAYIPKGQRKAVLGGQLIVGSTATVEYTDAVEVDCPLDLYKGLRVSPNQDWKYKEPEFKINYDGIKVEAAVDKDTGSIKADWPQCVKVKVPIKFPRNTKLEKLALGLSIYFPGCLGFKCPGRACKDRTGIRNGEECFTEDICKLQPVPAQDKLKDVIGFVGTNAEVDVCKDGYNGGEELITTSIICQTDDKLAKDKPCPVTNFFPDPASKRKQVVVVARLYEKQSQCRGFGCITAGKTCTLARYSLEGCRELGMSYTISAFGFSGGNKGATGVDRKTGTGGVFGGGFGSLLGGGKPTTSTEAATQATTTKSAVPWWQQWRRNWQGQGK